MRSIWLSFIYPSGLPWLLCTVGCLLVLTAYAAPPQAGEYSIFLEKNKKGLKDQKNNIIIPATYDDLGWSSGGFLPLEGVLGYKENGLWGLVSLKNHRIIAPHYTHLTPLGNHLLIAAKYDPISQEQIYGIINLKGNTELSFNYHHLEAFNNLIIASVAQAGEWKYGLLDEQYQEVIPYSYDNIHSLNGTYAIIQRQEKLGLIDQSGQIVVAPKYQEIQLDKGKIKAKPFDSFELKTAQNKFIAVHTAHQLKAVDRNLYLASGPNGSYLFNTLGTEVKSFNHCRIGQFQAGIAVIRQGENYGVVDTSGSLLIPMEYDSLWIDEEYVGIRDKDLHWMLINRQLVRVSQKDYQEIRAGSEGLFPIKRHGNWGFINNRGVEVIPPQYQMVKTFENGVAQAMYGGSWGLIDRSGNWLIRPRYYSLHAIDESTYIFQNGTKRGLVHTVDGKLYETGNTLISAPTAIIEKDADGNYGLISLRGEQLLSMRYQDLFLLQETPQYFYYHDSTGPGLFNVQNKTFIKDPSYQELRTINEEFIGVKINNQYGFIDVNGKLRIANRYQNIGVFKETMSPIKIKNKWGYIDRLERLKIQPIYDFAGPFGDGLAIVSRKGKFGLVNKQGKLILPLIYDRIERLSESRFSCYQGKRKGLADATGKVLLTPKYDHLEDLGNGYVIVNRESKYSLVSDQGVSVIPMIYDHIRYDVLNDLYILQKKQPWETIKL